MLLWDTRLLGHITTSLLSKVIVVGKSLGLLLLNRGGHISRVHGGGLSGHAWAGMLREVLWSRLFRGLDGIWIIDTIRAITSRFGSIETSLRKSVYIVAIDQSPYLDQVLALSLCHQRLKLRRREGVDQTGFRDHKEQDLRARQDR